ncbi:hypothetical protein BC829DRAFT_403767 [Chytridium lagenaria]|nr:hypothetical protein BC829DRAFT_403767 [Chytridium lagenaria]
MHGTLKMTKWMEEMGGFHFNVGKATPALSSCPQNILDNILIRLQHPVDFIRVEKTCKSLNRRVKNSGTWRRFAMDLPRTIKPNSERNMLTWKLVVAGKWKTICDRCHRVFKKSQLYALHVVASNTWGKNCWSCFNREWKAYLEMQRPDVLRKFKLQRDHLTLLDSRMHNIGNGLGQYFNVCDVEKMARFVRRQ